MRWPLALLAAAHVDAPAALTNRAFACPFVCAPTVCVCAPTPCVQVPPPEPVELTSADVFGKVRRGPAVGRIR